MNFFSQNEMIKLTDKKTILQDIVEEKKTAGFQSVSADELTVSNDEVPTICFCNVDRHKDIQEKFMTFVDLQRLTRVNIRNFRLLH